MPTKGLIYIDIARQKGFFTGEGSASWLFYLFLVVRNPPKRFISLVPTLGFSGMFGVNFRMSKPIKIMKEFPGVNFEGDSLKSQWNFQPAVFFWFWSTSCSGLLVCQLQRKENKTIIVHVADWWAKPPGTYPSRFQHEKSDLQKSCFFSQMSPVILSESRRILQHKNVVFQKKCHLPLEFLDSSWRKGLGTSTREEAAGKSLTPAYEGCFQNM